jgi:hypothetical protein
MAGEGIEVIMETPLNRQGLTEFSESHLRCLSQEYILLALHPIKIFTVANFS